MVIFGRYCCIQQDGVVLLVSETDFDTQIIALVFVCRESVFFGALASFFSDPQMSFLLHRRLRSTIGFVDFLRSSDFDFGHVSELAL